MSDPFLGEIRIFPFNFPPKGWASCDGQVLPIAQNTALFSLLGTTYGGDGRTTFGLPDLQGRAAMHPGEGPGLTRRRPGEAGGCDAVTLGEPEIPVHSHALKADDRPGQHPDPSGHSLGRSPANSLYQRATDQGLAPMAATTLATAGGGHPHNNLMPYVTMNLCIALQGIYPPRS